MKRFAAVLLAAAAFGQQPAIESVATPRASELTPDPAAPVWQSAVPVVMDKTAMGQPAPAYRTSIRSRWDGDNVHFLFSCPYDTLTANPIPHPELRSRRIWDWDYAELMIGSDFSNIENYREFGLSPSGEWYDYDRSRSIENGGGPLWSSGCKVKSRIDSGAKVWHGEISIPLRALLSGPAAAGTRFRVNFFRIQYVGGKRLPLAWSPPGGNDFPVPRAFRVLELR
jgi:hypothetical protein